jgi:hypothetical protein
MRILTGPRLLAAALAILYGLFVFWYGGRGAPLTLREVDALLADIQRNAGGEDGASPRMLEALRRVGEADDGREFYMVNLMRHREKAVYPEGNDFDDDVQAAERRYAAGILPRLLKRACLPVFVGTPTGLFIQPEGADVWDQVGIVRYRSRRDLLEMVAEPGMSAVGVHKWASLEKTQVFPVRPVISLVWLRGAVAVLLALLGVALHLALRRIPGYRAA